MLAVSGPLVLTATLIGVTHTATGPDHYLPFVAMARIGRWTTRKLIWVTLLCGVGHVLSSAVIGLVGIAFGIGLGLLDRIESARGDLAGWLLVGFGLAYLLWGIRHAIRNRPHAHLHAHDDGTVHSHPHIHQGEHLHVHQPAVRGDSDRVNGRAESMTPWVLFTIFLFGPCEVLIPMVMFPAARGDLGGVVSVTAIFGTATLVTMMTVVLTIHRGIGLARLGRWRRYDRAFAGAAVLVCGVLVMAGL